MNCLECGKVSKSQKGLHVHLSRCHTGVKDYYEKHYPRYDLYDGEKIEFVNMGQYLGTFFTSTKNRELFFLNESAETKKQLILEEWGKHKYTLVDTFKTSTYWDLTSLYKIETLEEIFGSIEKFCKEVGIENTWNYSYPLFEAGDCEILVDTREQNPFVFAKSTRQKLSIGDYMAIGKHFSKTAIDRKNPFDFVSSFSVDVKRIKNNLEMADKMGYNLIYIVEARPGRIQALLRNKVRTLHFPMAISNARTLLRERKNFQIVFCKDREQAQFVTKCVLYHGKDILNVDIQYLIEHGLD